MIHAETVSCVAALDATRNRGRCGAMRDRGAAMVERNAGVPEDRPIVFRIGIHLGDVVEEADGDLMGDGVNIAAQLEKDKARRSRKRTRTARRTSNDERASGSRSRHGPRQEMSARDVRKSAAGLFRAPGWRGLPN
jgi:hypothetical protein